MIGSEPKLLRDYTGDLRQLASVRRITLDDGPEQSQRALSFSTGGGLDFWVLCDRSMDIGPLWFEGMPLAWQHPNGYISPALYRRESDGGTGFERALSGFLITCGLAHTRQAGNGHPLHGALPLTPARLIACGEDWAAETPILYAEAEIVCAHLNGLSYRMTRRIEAAVGRCSFSIVDTVENIGAAAQELHILYHTNFGFPAVGPGTAVLHNGVNRLVATRHDSSHRSEEPTVACYKSGPDQTMTLELERPASGPWRGVSVTITAPAKALPFVQFWFDPRRRRNILAIEPSSSDRGPDGTSLPGLMLKPDAIWSARLDFQFARPGALDRP